MIVKGIDYITPFGKYKMINKSFSNEAHFDNWYDFMTSNGYKIIGVHEGECERG